MSNSRDDFSPTTKRILSDQVNGICSYKECNRVTKGPSRDSEDKAVNTGKAAHITAAAINGPRYDKNFTPAQRKSCQNGIWMCGFHADIIDSEKCTHTDDELRQWKREAIARARRLHLGQLAFDIEKQIAAFFARSQADLKVSRRGFSSARWIERDEIELIHQLLQRPNGQVVALLGEKGSGKSTLLGESVRRFTELGHAVLGLKADRIDQGVRNVGQLFEELAPPLDIFDCIKLAAENQPLTIIVDQLDALADIIDAKSRRLSLVLQFISEIRSLPNVQVLISCRDFDFHRDSRFLELAASEVMLRLPTWEQVEPILANAVIDTANWHEERRSLLRNPWHLALYLTHLAGGGSTATPFDSLQSLLDELWKRSILKGQTSKAKDDLARKAAHEMLQREELWLPCAEYQAEKVLIDELVTENVFTLIRGDKAFGFVHQSLMEHAVARAFLGESENLVDLVRRRAGSLQVRPILWMVLSYLRAVTPRRYKQQLESLLADNPRSHLRWLYWEFLCELKDPASWEVTVIREELKQTSFVAHILFLLRGKESWFRELQTHDIPVLMSAPAEQAWPICQLLVYAVPFAQDDVIKLVASKWINDPARDQLSWPVLEACTSWPASVVSCLCVVAGRSKLHSWSVMTVTEKVAKENTAAAIAVVKSAMLRTLMETDGSELPADSEETSWSETLREKRKQSWIEDTDEWHDLDRIAERAPKQFLDELFPLYGSRVESFSRDWRPHVTSYNDDHSQGTRFPEQYSTVYPIPQAMRVAIKGLAETSPDDFVEFANRHSNFNSLHIQNLLCGGYQMVTKTNSKNGLSFLLSDLRRLFLGQPSDLVSETGALLSKLHNFLSKEDVQALSEKIIGTSYYRHREEAEHWQLDSDRRTQCRLLARLPKHLLNESARVFLETHEYKPSPHSSEVELGDLSEGLREIKSQYDHVAMSEMSDDELLSIFDELVDSTDTEHPRDFYLGGSVQASREFQELAKQSPSRVAAILPRFRASDQVRPVGHALHGIAQSTFPIERLGKVILELSQAGFASFEFRWWASLSLVERRVGFDHIADEICLEIKNWLTGDLKTEEGNNLLEFRGNEKPSSILWERMRNYGEPHGANYFLFALTLGYLWRDIPKYEEWADALLEHVERTDAASTWRATTHRLHWLRNCKPEQLNKFINRLFERFPQVLGSVEGVILLKNLWKNLSQEVARNWLEFLRGNEWEGSKQAYGELLCYAALVENKDEAWANSRLRNTIDAAHASFDQAVCQGIVFTAAELWEDPRYRKTCTEVLEATAAFRSTSQIGGWMGVFLLQHPLENDEHSRRLLSMVAANPQLLETHLARYLFDELEAFVEVAPREVLALVNSIIDFRRDKRQFPGQREHYLIPSLVSLAMSLHRIDGFREEGLRCFEHILDMGFFEAMQAAREVDRRKAVEPRVRIRERK